MARRLSFSIAQPVTIIGWYIASFLLVADLSSIIHIVKAPGKRRALTQAFYYAIYSAALYFIIASLMMVTVYGAWKGHYPKEFKLTMSQRTLMLQTISFMIYMLGGAAVYAKIEGWQFLDAVYWADFTLLTVGVGDYTPSTHLGRGLLFPYAFGGIVILGLVVGSIRSLVLERGKKKLGSRQVEKLREKLIKKLQKKGQAKLITPIENESQAADVEMTERERRREEFELMREVQERASTRRKWVSLLFSLSLWMLLWFLGALIFYFAEHEQAWTYFQSLYFAYTTLLTIGYGDFRPEANSGKSFFVFWSLLAVPALTILISNMGDTVVKSIRDVTDYLGEFTFLPGEAGMKARIHQAITRLSHGKVTPPKRFQPRQSSSSAAATLLPTTPSSSPPDQTNPSKSHKPHQLPTNKHEHHYLLAQELHKVLSHLTESAKSDTPKRYTYDEWAWFLSLLGEDEADGETHRQPTISPRSANANATTTQSTETDSNSSPDSKGAAVSGEQKHGQHGQWSWLGDRSPLLMAGETAGSQMVEAEWVLKRLVVRLEKLLGKYAEEMTAKVSGSDSGAAGATGKAM